MPEGKVTLTRNGVAEIINKIWTDVLQTDHFNVDDHFLDLGGDSISAMLCISRIREKCDVELTFEDFFLDHATVLGLANIISDERGLP